MRSAVGGASIVIVVALMAASFAAGLVAGQRPTPTPSQPVRPSATPTRPPSPTPTPRAGIMAEAIVVPLASAEVSAPITASVEALFVAELDEVRAGQLLMRLDTSTRRAALEVAEADLGRAIAAADRAQGVLEQLPPDATLAQREAAEADVRLADAELTLARTALGAAQVALRQTEVRAAMAGTIAEIALAEGEQAIAGEPVITIADMSGWLLVTTNISELDVVGIAAGDAAVISFPALPDVQVDGVVDQVRVRGTSGAGGVRFEVVVRPVTHVPELRWGMTAQVRILTDR